MKLAAIALLAADGHSGRILSDELVPNDQAIRRVKDMIQSGECPDPRFPTVSVLPVQNLGRGHRFKPTADQVAKAEAAAKKKPAAPSGKVKDLQAALEKSVEHNALLTETNAELKAKVDELNAELEKLTAPPPPPAADNKSGNSPA